MGILAAEAFSVRSTYHRTKKKILGQLGFRRGMILQMDHIANCRYMRQRKKSQIEKEVIDKNSTIIDYTYNVGDKLLVRIKQAYKYETLFQGTYEIVQMRTNKAVTI